MDGKLIGVLGNNDGEKLGLLKNFQEIGGELHGEFCHLELDEFKIAIYHGTSNKLTEAIIASQMYDLVIHGHTHKKRDEKIRDTLVLNPGCAHRVSQYRRKYWNRTISYNIWYYKGWLSICQIMITLDDILGSNFLFQ